MTGEENDCSSYVKISDSETIVTGIEEHGKG